MAGTRRGRALGQDLGDRGDVSGPRVFGLGRNADMGRGGAGRDLCCGRDLSDHATRVDAIYRLYDINYAICCFLLTMPTKNLTQQVQLFQILIGDGQMSALGAGMNDLNAHFQMGA